MEKIAITKVQVSKNKVSTGEKITIKINAYSITPEPINERLAFAFPSGTKPRL